MKNSSSGLSRYPDGSSQKLRQAIAEFNKIDIENIICGNGSDEILSMIANCFAGPGDEII